MPVLWHTVMPVLWYTVMPVLWCTEMPVLCCTEMPVLWCTEMPVLWHTVMPVLWCTVMPVLWCTEMPVPWHPTTVTLRTNTTRCGQTTKTRHIFTVLIILAVLACADQVTYTLLALLMPVHVSIQLFILLPTNHCLCPSGTCELGKYV